MLPEDRRSRIQDLLSQKSPVTVSELAELFGASEMTVRRDLDELEARGVCQRIHGGATSLRVQEYRPPPYPPNPQREQCQVREKMAIGQAAAALVRPGDVIAVDSGTTAAYLAQALRAIYPLTVITNSIRVLDQLHDIIQIASDFPWRHPLVGRAHGAQRRPGICRTDRRANTAQLSPQQSLHLRCRCHDDGWHLQRRAVPG